MYCCAMAMRYRSFVITSTCVLRVPGVRVWPRVLPAWVCYLTCSVCRIISIPCRAPYRMGGALGSVYGADRL